MLDYNEFLISSCNHTKARVIGKLKSDDRLGWLSSEQQEVGACLLGSSIVMYDI